MLFSNTNTYNAHAIQQYKHLQYTCYSAMQTLTVHMLFSNTNTHSTHAIQQYKHSQCTCYSAIQTLTVHMLFSNTNTHSTHAIQQYKHLLYTCYSAMQTLTRSPCTRSPSSPDRPKSSFLPRPAPAEHVQPRNTSWHNNKNHTPALENLAMLLLCGTQDKCVYTGAGGKKQTGNTEKETTPLKYQENRKYQMEAGKEQQPAVGIHDEDHHCTYIGFAKIWSILSGTSLTFNTSLQYTSISKGKIKYALVHTQNCNFIITQGNKAEQKQ